jgi:hypothetical protein
MDTQTEPVLSLPEVSGNMPPTLCRCFTDDSLSSPGPPLERRGQGCRAGLPGGPPLQAQRLPQDSLPVPRLV